MNGLPRIVVRGSRTGSSMRSPSPRRRSRSGSSMAMNSPPRRCASPIPRRRRRARCSTTTWATASGCCARCRRCPRGMTRPPMWRAASWRRRRMERACRYRWCTVAIRRSTGAHRSGSTAMAPTASRAGGLQHQYPVAGRPRLHLCHRPYARRQGQGLSLVQEGKRRQKMHTFTDLHLRGTASDGRGDHRAGISLPRAEAPAAC